MTIKTDSKIDALTGLRWFAALGVYLYHFGLPPQTPHWLANLKHNGGLGVPFFFVLSGYVLSLRYQSSTPNFRRYLRSRFARIGPLYLVALFMMVIYKSIPNFPKFDLQFFTHLFALQAWRDSDNGLFYNGPGWTISVEMFFYLIFPLLSIMTQKFRHTSRFPIFLLLAGNLISAVPFVLHVHNFKSAKSNADGLLMEFAWPSFQPIYYVGLFMTGIASFLASRSLSESERFKLLFGYVSSLLLVVYLVVLIWFRIDNPNHPNFSFAVKVWLLGIPCGLLFMFLTLNETTYFSRILSSRPLKFLGEASFSFYIFHYPVHTWITRVGATLNYDFSYLQIFTLVLTFAIVMHVLIEKPLQKLISK